MNLNSSKWVPMFCTYMWLCILIYLFFFYVQWSHRMLINHVHPYFIILFVCMDIQPRLWLNYQMSRQFWIFYQCKPLWVDIDDTYQVIDNLTYLFHIQLFITYIIVCGNIKLILVDKLKQLLNYWQMNQW